MFWAFGSSIYLQCEFQILPRCPDGLDKLLLIQIERSFSQLVNIFSIAVLTVFRKELSMDFYKAAVRFSTKAQYSSRQWHSTNFGE